jgi:cytochrome c-type biogenesis protein CcmH/NrfG
VNAHLQLAAYEMAHGSRSAAERHLAAARRLEPHNPDAVALARLLRKQKNRRP